MSIATTARRMAIEATFLIAAFLDARITAMTMKMIRTTHERVATP
jgi:hypothetical protein